MSDQGTPTGRRPTQPNIQFLAPPMSPAALEMLRECREILARQFTLGELDMSQHMNQTRAEQKAELLTRCEHDKLRFSYVARPLIIEGAWYVAKLDCDDNEREVERFYA